MKNIRHNSALLPTQYIWSAILLTLLFYAPLKAQTQPGAPLGLPGDKTNDSLQFGKSNTDDWHTSEANIKIRYNYLNSNQIHIPDTSIHIFHRKPYSQTWNVNLGNFGSPVRNLQFTPERRFGPTLGYNVFDVYRIQPDSLPFYNTTVPYTSFTYNLGSKLEQLLNVQHTQNIKPNWNFAFGYNKISSQGFFLLQRASHDGAYFSTNFESINHRYKLYSGFTYNKGIHDENGGIADTSQLADSNYNERSNIDINYANAVSGSGSAVPRSLVTNAVRDYTFQLQHGYSWGKTDTLYNTDSTKITFIYTPRIGFSHEIRLSNQQYTYKDKKPDSLRYAPIIQERFLGDGTDSVFTRQKQNTLDNSILINGFVGKKDNQARFSAGAGVRLDRFSTRFLEGAVFTDVTSNYIIGRLTKEQTEIGPWFYSASAQFYITGAAAGNSLVHITAGKVLGTLFASANVGLQQNINNPAYNYTLYINQFDTITNSFKQESVTRVYGEIYSDKHHFHLAVNNYILANYLYMNAQKLPDQFGQTIHLLQLSGQKMIRWKGIVLDNEVLFQQMSQGAPVNVPLFLAKHQLSYEKKVFRNALQIATGLEMRYHSPYYTANYSPVYNRFYYNGSYLLVNDPVYALFFNFRIKRFRAYLMLDQMQQILDKKNVLYAPGYPAPDLMIRFGFNWTLLR